MFTLSLSPVDGRCVMDATIPGPVTHEWLDGKTHELRGADGRRARRIVVSSRRRSRLRMLHSRHAATTLSQVCVPPRLRGTTWSSVMS